jgi:hypothetical protein
MEDLEWGGGHEIGPRGVALFSWGPGDSIVVTAASAEELELTANSSRRGEAVPRMPAGGSELQEYRLHKPFGLWRHRRYVQRPFQLFFAETHNVWSERIRETIEISMDESCVEERRALLSEETLQYKVCSLPVVSAFHPLLPFVARSVGIALARSQANFFDPLCSVRIGTLWAAHVACL